MHQISERYCPTVYGIQLPSSFFTRLVTDFIFKLHDLPDWLRISFTSLKFSRTDYGRRWPSSYICRTVYGIPRPVTEQEKISQTKNGFCTEQLRNIQTKPGYCPDHLQTWVLLSGLTTDHILTWSGKIQIFYGI